MATRRTTSRAPSNRTARSRPGQRGTARTRSASHPSPQRARFTNRMAVLAVVFALLVVSYASSMKAYLRQRSHIADLSSQIASSKKQIGELQREKRRWGDQAYVEAQARQRLGWVLPGETSYQVIGRNGKPLTTKDALTDPRTIAQPQPTAWWARARTSLDAADHPKKYVKPVPVGSIRPPKTPAGQ